MKIIGLIGFSGSGKTHFLTEAIKKLKNYGLDTSVIKNIHEHQIDKEGKDTYKYIQSGAQLSVTKNLYNETTIFLKKELSIEGLINWIKKAPFKTDIIFFEGFRDLEIPTILCIKDENNIKSQLNTNVRALSGKIIINKEEKELMGYKLINIDKNFEEFVKLFNINELR
ncbi:MAG: molybdopterin-guanine dinucleotide biosynthesis protein B [Candidatus Lokiarchaeota archaeon]